MALQCFPVSASVQVAQALSDTLADYLASGKKVVWFISGGSSIPIAIKAAHLLLRRENLRNLHVTLVDELYLQRGDTQSNTYKLQQTGFVLTGSRFRQILRNGMDLKQMAESFDGWLQRQLDWSDITVGQFGIGAGYHTGGIQPGSVAAVENVRLAVGYQDTLVQRITVTPALIRRLDVAFVNSLGEDKRALVRHFCNSMASVAAEPTQVLKCAKITRLYSDVLPGDQ